ncbi:hypothetical protein MESS2_1580005 [Mesorhizobium metallidurans STM 2683]|uniref:Uncharacterized protein n=1 Tax=Mesorhizobium metallidurans STM 2683 TaxID=1297569 RepID=M5F0Z2_9HYPH|nr:hypothetical protein MESS2_1580005 [Mesorhizobium metallidurans STM 2683]
MGGRLLAMANAKALADRLGYRFGFTWKAIGDKEFHVIDGVEKIFSADFIEKYWLGEKIKRSDFAILEKTAFTRSSLDAAATKRNFRGWICNEFRILEAFRDEGAETIRRSETLRGFGFSANVKQALDAADKCRFPGPMAALHLRSGDIVRGKYRSSLDFADKVVPSTLAKSIVSELSSKGLSTLLIGEDRATLEYLRSETGALLTDDFGAREFEDTTLKAFFEMRLMARCQKIYAGSSVFATVASVMGDIPSITTTTLFDSSRAAEIILGELEGHQSDYHPFEAAFGYQAAFLNLEDRISSARAREILEKAHGLDPENDVYALKIAASYFRENDYRSGEAILKSLMTREFLVSAEMPLRAMRVLTVRLWRGHVMSKDFESFFAAARAGFPYAAACSAHILHRASGELKPALRMIAQSLRTEPTNTLFKKIRGSIRPITSPKSGLLPKARSGLWKAGIRI